MIKGNQEATNGASANKDAEVTMLKFITDEKDKIRDVQGIPTLKVFDGDFSNKDIEAQIVGENPVVIKLVEKVKEEKEDQARG